MPVASRKALPKTRDTVVQLDPSAPCPIEAPYFVPPDVAKEALPRCAAFVASRPPGSRELATALGRQAFLQFHAEEREEASATIEKALAIDPDNLIALLSKVEIAIELAGPHDARSDIEHLKAVHPDEPHVRGYYADLMSMLGTPEEELAAIDSALELVPDDPNLHLRHAGLLARLGRDDEALAELDFIVETMPDSSAYFTRAEIELARGDAAAARADAEKARAMNYPVDRMALLLVQANLMLGDLDKALEAVTAAEAQFVPQSDTPLFALYRFAILDRLGRKEEAEKALSGLAKERKENILRVQVFLRNMGFDDVPISGAFDNVTKRQLAACLVKGDCGGPLSKRI